MKKTVCALLCAALAVTLACPALAAERAERRGTAGAGRVPRGQHRQSDAGQGPDPR